MYDKKVVRRRRTALAVLVGLSLVLLTVSFGDSAGGGVHAVQRGAQEVLSPIEAGVSKVLKPVRDLAGWTGDVFRAKKENKQLEREVSQLRQQVAQGQTAQRDAQELRSLVNLPKSEGFPTQVKPITARVIARSPTVWYSAVDINKGRADGVRLDQPVVTGDGLAGKVTDVGSGTARVTLITDDTSAVSAEVMPDGANGIVKPEVGNPNDLLLDFIQKGAKIRAGQTVTTSGFTSSRLDSLFPRSIPIGRVSRVEPSELELYQRVHVRPYADLRRMDYVQVLTGGGGGQQRAQVGQP